VHALFLFWVATWVFGDHHASSGRGIQGKVKRNSSSSSETTSIDNRWRSVQNRKYTKGVKFFMSSGRAKFRVKAPSSIVLVLDCFPCRQTEGDDEDDQETPASSRHRFRCRGRRRLLSLPAGRGRRRRGRSRNSRLLPVIVLVVVVVGDCFPCRQSEGDDDEDDQETPASSRHRSRRRGRRRLLT
jgi:hypothetical protein